MQTVPARLDPDGQLLCPRCGETYLHRHDAVLQEGNPACRGEGITLRFWCEHCSENAERSFTLWMTQHKGNTFVEWKAWA